MTFGKMGARKMMCGKPYLKRIQYLESTGAQWIDTGVIASQNIKIESRFYRTIAPSNFVYGARHGSATITCATGIGTSDVHRGYARWGNSAYAAVIPNTRVVVVVQDKYGVTVNGTHYNYTKTESVVSQPGYTIALFAAKNTATTATLNLDGKIWYCKIWDNGVLVRDLVPVLDLDGEPKMFDAVTQSYPTHYGSFIAGPDLA